MAVLEQVTAEGTRTLFTVLKVRELPPCQSWASLQHCTTRVPTVLAVSKQSPSHALADTQQLLLLLCILLTALSHPRRSPLTPLTQASMPKPK